MSADIERRARLSYDQVKRSSGFKSHIMISDYLGIAEESSAQDDRISINEEKISSNSIAIASNAANISGNSERISDIEDFLDITYVLGQSTDYTTAGKMFIEMTADILVTLDPLAAHGDCVSVYRNTSVDYPRITDGFGIHYLTIDQSVMSYKYIDTLGWVAGA